MERIVSAAQMKEIDRFSIQKIGIPSLVLMERAAMAVADCAHEYLQEACGKNPVPVNVCSCGRRLTAACVCGYGNNGADGIAVARMLAHKQWPTEIWMVGAAKRATEEVKAQLSIVKKLGIPVKEFRNDTDFSAYTVIIDALFGIGLARPVEDEYALAVQRINESEAKVVSVDIASGICADNGSVLGTAVRADATVTFGYRKPGHLLYPGAEYSGRVITADIGFPLLAEDAMDAVAGSCLMAYEKEDIQLLPQRYAYSNKGSYGKILICAGSSQMSGAAYLAAAGAYHMGAGLVRILTDKENYSVLAGLLPEALITCYDSEKLACMDEGTVAQIQSAVNWAGAVVLGPGIGRSQAAKNLVEIVLSYLREADGKRNESRKNEETMLRGPLKPCIVDADALNILADWIAERTHAVDGRNVSGLHTERITLLAAMLPEYTILTPHLLELSRLIGVPVQDISADLIDTADKCTYNNKLVYVIKDARTIIAQGNVRAINTSGCEGMATGGSGDVLTGIIAALATGIPQPFTAAGLGVYIHGLAGMEAAKELSGRYMLAGDIIAYLSKVIKD